MVVGFGIVAMVKDWAHIMNMCVAPGYRRRGLGQRILLQLLKVAKRQHASRAWLEVRPTNHPAVRLYLKMGFRKIQIRKNYYVLPSAKENAIVMVRRL
jgi:ribosomal-protein-alanine N-acetyltransferase